MVTVAAVMTSQVGCYTTKVVSHARPPSGPESTERQWFMIGGLVPVSDPAGRECKHGFATVESKLSGTDWLINAGLTVAGGIAGGLTCGRAAAANPNDDTGAFLFVGAACAAAFSALVPFMISSRTVEYTCAAGDDGGRGGRLDFMPPRQGYRMAPSQEESAPVPAEAPLARTL
ncbi:hypothetical protein BON30_32665 [Cystobacter ferrugineus]|uniref:Uncharacterized protein n=2 Tax=Cystobacter ferrugineus TaxID=83449 RepID=A0A1L9B2M2_9BACT|nr:hypothetical protein BON30_32665 [Cystobacter ferrugineus]